MIPENGTKTHSLWKKRRKRKFNKVFILLIVLVYIVSRTTPILTENPNRLHTITHGTLEDTISFEGIILRNEQVIANHSRGMTVDSGQRVAKGQSITAGLKSPASGIIMETHDGLGESLKLEEVVHNPDPYLESIEGILDNDPVDTQEGIRLITGYHWGAVGNVTPETAEEIQPGQRVWIEAQGQRARGTIVWSKENESTNNSLVLVQSSEYLEGIHENRKLNLTLIKRKVEGLSVPIEAVYHMQEKAYVTRRKSGNNMEVPVNIILADEQRAILSADQFTDSQGTVQRTVSLYDEIILDQGNNRGKEGINE